ncbi:MAG: hypothetical protein WAO08_28685 [Hyphomicrobiaceae bacterium]
MTIHDYRLSNAITWSLLSPDNRGKRTPQTLQAIAERNALLVEAACHFQGLSAREVGRRLHVALVRYQQGRWRRSRIDPVCPHEPGTLAAALWEILRCRDHIVSERTIRAVLSRA